jgi:hypothetical protein
MTQIFSKRAPFVFAGLFAAAVIVACGKDTTSPSTPGAIAVATAPPATAQVASAIPGPSVTVTDAGGSPAVGVVVTFAVTGGGGAIQYSNATTDAQGIASSGLWQIGPKVGVNTATAAVGSVAPLTFTVTSQPGPASTMSVISGNAQQAPPGSTLPTPLTVRVTDAGGNAKPGVAVTFAVTAGGGSLSATTATTNASGDAVSGSWTLGGCPQSVQTVSASAGTLQTTFTSSSRGTIAPGQTVNGTLATTDCIINGAYAQQYEITGPALNISLASSAFDAFVNVMDSAATYVGIFNDNDPSGGTTNSAIARLIVGPGLHTITATSATAGATGPYTLVVSSASEDLADCSTTFIAIGTTTNQTLAPSDCKTNYSPAATAAQTGEGVWKNTNAPGDAFLVYIAAGTTVRISQTAQPLDAAIAFYAPDGSLIFFRDNGGVGVSGTEVINYTSGTSGFYKIVAGSYCVLYNDPYQGGCDYGPYTLSVIKQ